MPTVVLVISMTVLYLAFIYSFEIFKDYFLCKLISLLLSVFIFYALLYNVTYNSDWNMYDAIFMGHTQSNDFLFNFISSTFSDKGYDYSSVYKLHIFLIGVGFFYFIGRNSYSNVFGIITTYLLFQFVPVSNQIRYYVAFSFFLIAVYNLIVSRNKGFFIVFAFLSVLSHSAIFLMYPFLYFYYYASNENYIRKLIVYSLILAGFFYFISFVGFIFSFHFGSYFEEGFLSSISGGLLNNFIWLFWLFFIYIINKRLMETNSSLLEFDVKYQFFYKLSFYCLLFFPVSIMLQVLAHRYIAASLIIWLVFYYYSLSYEESLRHRMTSISLLLLLISATFFYMYFLPTYLLGVSTTEAVFELFLSNTFFFNSL